MLRRTGGLIAFGLLGSGCDVVFGLEGPETTDVADAANADTLKADAGDGNWSKPELLLSSGTALDAPTLPANMLELYYNQGDGNSADIYISQRTNIADDWPTGVPFAFNMPNVEETNPEISRDGLTLFFASNRAGTLGGNDIYMTTRETLTSAWNTPLHVTELSSNRTDSGSAPSANVLQIFLHSKRVDGSFYDLFFSTRPALNMPWATPSPITELNTPRESSNPFLSDDGLDLYFDSTRPGGTGESDLYVAHRATASGTFGPPVPLTELNTLFDDRDPWVSPDGRTIIFTSARAGGKTSLWISTR